MNFNGSVNAREGHPNADVLASKIDGLEGLTGGLITGSGMAAIGAVFWLTMGFMTQTLVAFFHSRIIPLIAGG